MLQNENSPLLIETVKFGNFNNYISSLDKKTRNEFKRVLDQNLNVEYSLMDNDPEMIQDFMNMWSNQPLSNGLYPIWGDFNSKSVCSMDCEVKTFKATIDGRIISIHFVFKWDDYIYCNAPLYNKELYRGIGIAKYMWLKLIEYAIENRWRFLDLMGPGERDSWQTVLINRSNSNEAGDIGYKWKLVPSHVKSNPYQQVDYKVKVCNKCGYKNLVTHLNPDLKCKCLRKDPKKLLIIAHPDDESVFFGNWLIENKDDVKVACIFSETGTIDKFSKLMSSLEIPYETCGFRGEFISADNIEKIRDILYDLKYSNEWDMVVTHGPYGEYGAIQHIDIHNLVKSVFGIDKLYVYDVSSTPMSKELIERKWEMCKSYGGLGEYKNSGSFGSDWFKHVAKYNFIDYETIVPLNTIKTILKIGIITPYQYYGYPFYDYIFGVITRLKDHGHDISYIDISHKEDLDLILVFDLDTAELLSHEIPYVFIMGENNMSDFHFESTQDINRIKKVISKSARTIVSNIADRNILGNMLTCVYINQFKTWEEIVLRIEANIYMALKYVEFEKVPAKLPRILTELQTDGSKLTFRYNGGNKESVRIIIINKDLGGELDYIVNINPDWAYYWIMISEEYRNCNLLVKIFNDDNGIDEIQEIRIK